MAWQKQCWIAASRGLLEERGQWGGALSWKAVSSQMMARRFDVGSDLSWSWAEVGLESHLFHIVQWV